MTSLAAIGLGSNVGDREVAIRSAVARLGATPGVIVVATSSLYESEPWGYVEQPRFLNAVAVARIDLGPIQLLLRLKQVELEIGRSRTFHWGPREIDLDLLIFGDLKIERRGLTVPHPGLLARAFVLVPLAEVWPDAPLPDQADLRRALVALEPESRSLRIVGSLAG